VRSDTWATRVALSSAVTCDDVAEALSAAPDGALSLDPSARRHVEQCLHCQAEAVQYRRLLRTLRAMRADLAQPAPGLLDELLGALDESARRGRARLTGRRAAYVGGLAAATAAGVGGVIVLASRTRRRLPLAG